MRNLTINKYSFQLPSSWNELTTAQLRVVFKAFQINQKPEYVKIQLLKECTGLTKLPWKRRVRELMYLYPFRYKYNVIWLAAIDVAHATSAFNFLFDDENHFASGLTANPLRIILLKHKYFGPTDAFANLTVGEWMATETLMARYAETNDPEYLLRFFATLWRQHDKEHVRQLLAENSEENYPEFLRLKSWQIQAMIHWYDSCSIDIRNRFPSVFPKPDETETKKPKRIMAAEVFKSFMSILEMLADNDVTKKPIVRSQFLYDALFTWQSLIEQNKKLEEMQR